VIALKKRNEFVDVGALRTPYRHLATILINGLPEKVSLDG